MTGRSIAEIRVLFTGAPLERLESLIAEFSSDGRAGVAAILTSARRRLAAEAAERERVRALMSLQLSLESEGYRIVAGVDEVGRGALAGPVTAAAVVLPGDVHIPRLDDSKRLTPAQREDVAAAVRAAAVAVSVAHIGPDRIDALGIAVANTLAMRSALQGLGLDISHTIADGLEVDLGLPATFVVGGDRLCGCVSAASVVAKVERDALMRTLDPEFPHYGFALNKGYGTLEHIDAIREFGPCSAHRLSFSPCSQDSLF